MGRAELRRSQREHNKKTATYTLTKEQIEQIKIDATEEAANIAFALLLTLPLEVLMDHYWPKTYNKKIPEFVNYILEYYRMWQDGELSMEDLKKDLWEYAGIRLEAKKI